MDGANIVSVTERPSAIDIVGTNPIRSRAISGQEWGAIALAGCSGIAVIGALLFAVRDHQGGLASALAVIVIAGLASLGIAAWSFGRSVAARGRASAIALAVERCDDAQFITGRDGRIVTDNAACRALLDGLKRDSVVTIANLSALADFVAPESATAFDRLRTQSMTALSDFAEIVMRREGGAARTWRLGFRMVDGDSTLLIWTIEDTTQQRADVAKRSEEEAYLADLMDRLPVGFFSATHDGVMRYVNRTLAEWLGVTPGMGDGQVRRFADFVVHDRAEQDVEADASGMHGTIMLTAHDGQRFPIYLLQSQAEDARGGFLYSRSVVLRQPFLPVLDDGPTLLRRIPWLFSEAPVGIVKLDLDGVVVDCNRAFLKLLGLHRHGVLGRPLVERIAREDRSDTEAQLSKVVMGTVPATLIDVRMPASGERELQVSLYVSRVTDADGEATGLALHVIDTTEQKSLEVQFNQAQKMQAVGQLAGGVAHDFNNLLTAMIGFCDLLFARHTESDPSFHDIMQIKQNANRAANLVRQLLAFSRRQTLQPKIFSIADALNDMSNLLRRLIGENIALEISHGDGVDLIRTDPGQFDQVIINLVVNARDAMKRGGTVSITTQKVRIENSIQRGHEVMHAGDYVLIDVVDTGSGIAKEDINRIWEPFFSTKGVGEGTGLGLSTVYGIVRQSDGYIFVDSAIGLGTTFSMYLPAFSAADATAIGAELTRVGHMAPVDDRDLTGEATVLLVEDEDAVRLFGSRALRNKGYRVLEAGDGEQALDVINEYGAPIDLIITDVMMPGMDGHTLVKLVQEELPDIKVILMSGYAEEAIPGGLGGDPTLHFLPKPFSLQELAGKVKEVISG